MGERSGDDIEQAFELLGLDPSATLHDARVAFAGQCRLFHPDRYADAAEPVQQAANERMREAIEAYRLVRFTIEIAGVSDDSTTATVVVDAPLALRSVRVERSTTPYDELVRVRPPLGWIVDAVA